VDKLLGGGCGAGGLLVGWGRGWEGIVGIGGGLVLLELEEGGWLVGGFRLRSRSLPYWKSFCIGPSSTCSEC
jgi:hypothetical protein